jgi:hypothetical protein
MSFLDKNGLMEVWGKVVNLVDEAKENVPNEIYVGDGEMPDDATIQIIVDGSDEEEILKNDLKEYIDDEIVTELAKRGQLAPEFANNIEECVDTTKLYVLPDGYIYSYVTESV